MNKALEKAGAKLGHDVRMEQQGAMGKVDEITESEIKSADLVLIAADKVVEDEDRFAGKQIVRVKIGQCVSNAEGVLKKIAEAMEKRK